MVARCKRWNIVLNRDRIITMFADVFDERLLQELSCVQHLSMKLYQAATSDLQSYSTSMEQASQLRFTQAIHTRTNTAL